MNPKKELLWSLRVGERWNPSRRLHGLVRFGEVATPKSPVYICIGSYLSLWVLRRLYRV